MEPCSIQSCPALATDGDRCVAHPRGKPMLVRSIEARIFCSLCRKKLRLGGLCYEYQDSFVHKKCYEGLE